MFSRRVFGTTSIPRAMYSRLHIANAAHANRLLPSLVPLSAALERSVPLTNILRTTADKACAPATDLSCTDPVLLRAIMDSLAPMQLSFLKLLELWGIGRPLCVETTGHNQKCI